MPNNDDIHDFEEIDDLNDLDQNEELDLNYEDDGNFDDVLQLTEYNDTSLSNSGSAYVVAEYDNIDLVEVNKTHKFKAKKVIDSITKFILDFDDIQLTENHKTYIKAVANLQFEQLNDMLSLVSINKMMLENMVRRINSVQAEDYSMINTYNNILNQHLKLHKELSNTYRNIPTVLRKMRLDVIENPSTMLKPGEDVGDTVSENFGETHFNNSKQMLKTLRERQQKRLEMEQNPEPKEE